MSAAPCTTAGAATDRLLGAIAALGVPHGVEDSLKLSAREGLVARRLLVGVHRADLSWSRFEAIVLGLGLPPADLAALADKYGEANAIGFAVEERDDAVLWKVYLEFWDAVRAGAVHTPVLMHQGLKWTEDPAPRVAQARYIWHPLLAHDEILNRISAVYGSLGDPGRLAARRIVKACARAAPRASLIYLEAAEDGNPRRSFDINAYRTELLMADAQAHLQTAGEAMGIDAATLQAALDPLASARLGHLSGGLDRHGSGFLSVYAERQPL